MFWRCSRKLEHRLSYLATKVNAAVFAVEFDFQGQISAGQVVFLVGPPAFPLTRAARNGEHNIRQAVTQLFSAKPRRIIFSRYRFELVCRLTLKTTTRGTGNGKLAREQTSVFTA